MSAAHLILASASPRRFDLLMQVGLRDFEVIPPHIDESRLDGEAPDDYVRRLSLLKAASVARSHPDSIIIACDTVVVLGDEIMGKPSSREDSRRMLTLLSGNRHRVLSGVCVSRGAEQRSFCESTSVTMRSLSDAEIDAYLDSGEPFDKAGSYAVQGLASVFVSRVEGDYYNVIGLPLCPLASALAEFGLNIYDCWSS